MALQWTSHSLRTPVAGEVHSCTTHAYSQSIEHAPSAHASTPGTQSALEVMRARVRLQSASQAPQSPHGASHGLQVRFSTVRSATAQAAPLPSGEAWIVYVRTCQYLHSVHADHPPAQSRPAKQSDRTLTRLRHVPASKTFHVPSPTASRRRYPGTPGASTYPSAAASRSRPGPRSHGPRTNTGRRRRAGSRVPSSARPRTLR